MKKLILKTFIGLSFMISLITLSTLSGMTMGCGSDSANDTGDPTGGGGAGPLGSGGSGGNTPGSGGSSGNGGAGVSANATLQVEIGENYTCALMQDHSVKCWGDNQYGQLGDGTTTNHASPAPVLTRSGGPVLTGVESIMVGEDHSCALMNDNSIKCWGNNVNGQLGDGTTTNRPSPVDVLSAPGGTALMGARSLVAGYYHTCALMEDTSVKCWGNNGNGQLGDGTNTRQPYPVPVLRASGGQSLTGVRSLVAGLSHACALMEDNSIKCWGRNISGQLGNGTTENQTYPVAVLERSGGPSLTNVLSIAAGDNHTCALMNDHSMKCWGDNRYGQLGTRASENHYYPGGVLESLGGSNLTGIRSIKTGGVHTCALMNDHSIKCWGDNSFGQLGDGTITNHDFPTPVLTTSRGQPLNGVQAMELGFSHTCVLMNDRSVKCWGDNGFGQLGNGSTSRYPSPTPTLISRGGDRLMAIRSVVTGNTHACALMEDTSVKCWGYNEYGQLGDGTTTNRPSPVDVLSAPGGAALTGVTSLVTGNLHTCALMNNNTIKCWGNNDLGQLGDGTTTNRPSPVDVLSAPGGTALMGVRAIAAGSLHTCALMQGLSIKCWGNNASGQLGDGTLRHQPSPVTVVTAGEGPPLAAVTSIIAGANHTCALMNHSAKCWGEDYYGQLGVGDGTATNRRFPVDVLVSLGGAPLSDIRSIIAGANHTCALMNDNSIKCWGYNNIGQLGDGSTQNQLSPTSVVTSTEPRSDLTGVSSIAGGSFHTCALMNNHSVKCWGDNVNGQLGDGTTIEKLFPNPTLINLAESPSSLTLSANHTCVTLGDGSAKCWGDNTYGQLGNGDVSGLTPVSVNFGP